MKRKSVIAVLLGGLLMLSMCRKPEPFAESQYDERLSGGSNTVFDNTSHAFANPIPGLSAYDEKIHDIGDSKFEATFVTAPSPINNGLGPLYNNVSCASCHHNDAIGQPTAGEARSALLIRVSVPGTDEHGGPLPVPGYGLQIQDKANLGTQPECKVNISYSYQRYTLPDGTSYELRTPTYTLSNLYAPMPGAYLTSARVPLAVFGLGMLENIPESSILANADPNDADGDGISGKPNYVWDPVSKSKQLGRFGWKASVPNILTQVAGALVKDIGITTSIFPNEEGYDQPQADGLKDDPELADSLLHAINFYMHSLAVPARRNVTDETVQQGKRIFIAAKCSKCHIETMVTSTNVVFPQMSNQRIHPYTDLLLHDMGLGLADGRPDYEADGQEWRTPPLWGIGLYETVSYPPHYLNDGRARTLLEAIMWHGGEAAVSKRYVEQLSTADRNALLSFLKSL